MFHPAKLAAATLLLALAGCATATRDKPPDVSTDKFQPPPLLVTTPAESRNTTVPTPSPPPARLTAPTETWVSLDHWARANHLGAVTNLQANPGPAFGLSTAAGQLVLRTGSQMARWNGLELRLGFAPRLMGSQPFVHTLDLQKNLIPLLSHPWVPFPEPRVIVIDPGHGGHDGGTHSSLNGRPEKEFTLDWARRLQPLLEAAGWQVFLTRTNDIDLTLGDRVAFADNHQATVFLSLHFNAVASSEHAGLETYCLTPTGMPSNVTRGYEDDLALAFPNNTLDARNLQLALRLHGAILTSIGGQDRGVRRARFLGVLRAQNRPAVLVEGGYLSNPREAAMIHSPEHRQKLAEAVARALQ